MRRLLTLLVLFLRQPRRVVRTVKAFLYDAARFMQYAPAGRNPTTAGQFDALITHDYHALEKGLSLPAPRPGFGVRYVTSLIEAVATSVARFGWRGPARVAVGVLDAYQKQQDATHKNPQIDAFLTLDVLAERLDGGSRQVTRQEILATSRMDLSGFFSSRSSIRDFSDEPVPVDVIEAAVSQAISTPSVCNRQAWGVYLAVEGEDIARALAFQNGNRGFSDKIDKLLVVTVDLERFLSTNERFQSWIDGGMFSMSLVYALHSLGLGTCCLNMSTAPSTDRALRQSLPIRDNENVVMMIAVGNLPEQLRVTESPRRPLDEILHRF